MRITYSSKKIERICTDASAAEKAYGRRMAARIQQRIQEIKAADSVNMLIQYHIGRCHPLVQNRKGQFAMDLVHPYRLIFETGHGNIRIANILEIADYH